jgi:hypothetical protein
MQNELLPQNHRKSTRQSREAKSKPPSQPPMNRTAAILFPQDPNIPPVFQRGQYQRDQSDTHQHQRKLAWADETFCQSICRGFELKKFVDTEAESD